MFRFKELMKPRIIDFALLVVLLFGLFAEIHAQNQSWAIGQGKKLSVSQVSSPPLRIKSSGKLSLRSFRFVGAVGGVNFEEVAAPAQGQLYQNVSILYDRNAKDGQRLVVLLDGDRYTAALSDWQLIPIARFADTDYTAVVSLFGEGPDTENYYYIQYHEAFENTLLGLRLLQADILFIDLSNHWELPQWSGRSILGLGESLPDTATSVTSMIELQKILRNSQWRSWVLTDVATEPRFYANENGFQITASPYYYFWDLDQADQRQELLELKYDEKYDAYQGLLDEYNSKVVLYNASRNLDTRQRLDVELNALDRQIKQEESDLKRMRDQLDNPTVREVSDLTEAMRAESETLRQYNSAVFDAHFNTAAYAAFFRYVKSQNRASWDRFKSAIAHIPVRPEVKTPTTWER